MTVGFVDDLADWLRSNRTVADLLKHELGATFVDKQGVRRYLSNWQPADLCPEDGLTVGSLQLLEHLTGNKQVAVQCGPSVGDLALENSGEILITSFLTNWERLWRFLETDNEDEIGKHAPLLSSFVDVIFHHRTSQLMVVLFVYNSLAFGILELLLPPPFSVYYNIYNHFQLLQQFLTYQVLRVMFYGGNVATPIAEDAPEISVEETMLHSKLGLRNPRGWAFSCSRLFATVRVEVRSLFCGLSNHRSSRSPASCRKRLPFYTLLNVALKFLTRVNGFDPQRTNFNKFSYRTALLLMVTVMPLFQVCTFAMVNGWHASLPCGADPQGDICTFVRWSSAATLGLTTLLVMKYIYSASIVLSLVGLAYGGEISNRLVNSWILKFGTLRKIRVMPIAAPCSSPEFSCNKRAHGLAERFQEKEERERERSASSNSEAFVFSNFSTHNPLRVLKTERNDYLTEMLCSSQELQDLITQGASEHYLFIREVMFMAGRTWSFGLMALFVLAVYDSVSFAMLVEYIVPGNNLHRLVAMTIRIVWRVMILGFYPILSICHANTHVEELTEIFTVCGTEDFSLLGGRARWISMLQSSPAVWTLYGLWITSDRLVGVIWTAITALGMLAATRFL